MTPEDRHLSNQTNPSSVTSSGSSLWILPSPHESDTSARSIQNSPAGLDFPLALAPEGRGMTFSIGSTTDSSVLSHQAQAGSTGTAATAEDSSLMIMPDEIIEQDDFRYPTAETFGQCVFGDVRDDHAAKHCRNFRFGTIGPQYWEERRRLWLSGQLYAQSTETKVTRASSNYTSLPLTSPEAASAPPSSSNSLSHYLGLSMKARGKLPSFLVNALPSSSSSASQNTSNPPNPPTSTSGPTIPSNPSSLARSRVGGPQQQAMSYGQYQAARSSPSPLAQTKGGDDPIDRLEALLAEPGAEETDRVWKQGGLEAVSKFLIDGKLLKRGIRLGLVVSAAPSSLAVLAAEQQNSGLMSLDIWRFFQVKILRASWIHDGTWPTTHTLSGASRAQLESLQNDPFFASPPRPTLSLPVIDIDRTEETPPNDVTT